jgi:hypothetical protein
MSTITILDKEDNTLVVVTPAVIPGVVLKNQGPKGDPGERGFPGEAGTPGLRGTAGDVELTTIGGGVLLKSLDGTRYRIAVANDGTLIVTAAPDPAST